MPKTGSTRGTSDRVLRGVVHSGVFGVGAGGAANSTMQPWAPLPSLSPPSAAPSMYVCLAHARAHRRTQAPMHAPVPVTNAAPHRMQLHTSCTPVSLTHQLHTSCTPVSLTLDSMCPLSSAACVCLRVCNLCCAGIERRHVPMCEQIWGGVRGGGGVGTRRREAQCERIPERARQSCAGLEAALPIAAPAPGSDSSIAERRSRIGRRWKKRGKHQRKRGKQPSTSERGKQQSLPRTANRQ
jgi:hypothetical protein